MNRKYIFNPGPFSSQLCLFTGVRGYFQIKSPKLVGLHGDESHGTIRQQSPKETNPSNTVLLEPLCPLFWRLLTPSTKMSKPQWKLESFGFQGINIHWIYPPPR